MDAEVQEVLAGQRPWAVARADCLPWLASLPESSVDLVLGSPPYESCRLYLESGEDLGIARDTETWVSWMVQVVRASLRVCRGLVCFVVEGQTKNYRYSCGPALLMADLHRSGVHLRKPPVYRRVGIPGSGGPDWLRNDWEWCLCATNGGRLPWSDNTACGHPPLYAPGGALSHRTPKGCRVNQWGMRLNKDGSVGATLRGADGGGHPDELKRRTRKPSHRFSEMSDSSAALFDGTPPPKDPHVRPHATSGYEDGDTANDRTYNPPALANPGNVIDCPVGGGRMGSELAHENEAPYPEQLAEFFVLSFCPPGGLVLDPFSGSGTTGATALRHGRRYLGCDLRQSQVDLSRRRLAGETPSLFASLEE